MTLSNQLNPAPPRPAAFLDRDGVINVDHGYTFKPMDLEFTPTAVAGIKLLNQAGYLVLVVTNQSGVARGLYSIQDVERFHDHMQASLQAQGAHIDAFYYAPYHPDGIIPEFSIDHDDRKPGAGMIRRAMQDWNVASERSFMIGDKQSDAESAAAAGINSMVISPNDGDLASAVRIFLTQ